MRYGDAAVVARTGTAGAREAGTARPPSSASPSFRIPARIVHTLGEDVLIAGEENEPLIMEQTS